VTAFSVNGYFVDTDGSGADTMGNDDCSKRISGRTVHTKDKVYIIHNTVRTELFCAAREGDTLYFQEYLGDPEALPGIVAALGAEKARVRLPGGDKPFAMYRSFTEDGQLPSYLGIALD
jgi:hypothetical protein